MTEIKEIEEMFEMGMLSEEEYKNMKAEITKTAKPITEWTTEADIVKPTTEWTTECTIDNSNNDTEGFLQIGEVIDSWEIKSLITNESLEAEIYLAQKDWQKGVVKYSRGMVLPNINVLEKIKRLDNENIIKIYKTGEYKGKFYEISEYIENGPINSRKADKSYKFLPLSETAVLDICKKLNNALKVLHDADIIHRDIKPGNIYCKSNGEIVIADFGSSSLMKKSDELQQTRNTARTSAYAPPEILKQEINYKYDYFSLGVTLWELAMGKQPYVNEDGKRLDPALIMQLSLEGLAADKLLDQKPHLSAKLQRLIRGLLTLDPKYRWGYEQVNDYLAGKNVELKEEDENLIKKTGDALISYKFISVMGDFKERIITLEEFKCILNKLKSGENFLTKDDLKSIEDFYKEGLFSDEDYERAKAMIEKNES